jgi:hypothetical protein
MSEHTQIPRLERVTFFEGQRLTAADLAAAQAYERELRWLHNRSLHAWGVARGLGVSGARGDRAVVVAPGYAVDARGRELVLLEPRTEPVPPVAAAPDGTEAVFLLTLVYADDEQATALETREGVCLGRGAVRLADEAHLAWRRMEDVTPDADVVLAQIWVANCRLSRAVSLAVRRDARATTHPHIAAGRTVAGATPWRFWGDPAEPEVPYGVETSVDTSSGRFHTTPQYQAHVAGERELVAPGFDSDGDLIEGFVRIETPSPAGFVVRMLLPGGLAGLRHRVNTRGELTPALLDALTTRLGWHVVWMGVEG